MKIDHFLLTSPVSRARTTKKMSKNYWGYRIETGSAKFFRDELQHGCLSPFGSEAGLISAMEAYCPLLDESSK